MAVLLEATQVLQRIQLREEEESDQSQALKRMWVILGRPQSHCDHAGISSGRNPLIRSDMIAQLHIDVHPHIQTGKTRAQVCTTWGTFLSWSWLLLYYAVVFLNVYASRHAVLT